MIYLKEKYAKKNQKQKDKKNAFKYDCKHVFQEMWELQDVF